MIFYQRDVFVYVLSVLFYCQVLWWQSLPATLISHRRHRWNSLHFGAFGGSVDFRHDDDAMLAFHRHYQNLVCPEVLCKQTNGKFNFVSALKIKFRNNLILQLGILFIFFGFEFGYVNNEFASGLVAFAVIGFLFDLLLDTFTCGTIFQGEFGKNSTEFIGSGIGNTVLGYTQPQKEFAVTVKKWIALATKEKNMTFITLTDS